MVCTMDGVRGGTTKTHVDSNGILMTLNTLRRVSQRFAR